MIDKDRLNQAFRGFRKRGLMARQNFSCCAGCGGVELVVEAEKLVERGKKPKGAVFYHIQANDRMKEGKSLTLNYGQLDSVKLGGIGLPTVEVGKIIVEECRKVGLRVEWNGDEKKTIEILPGDPLPLTAWERLQLISASEGA